MDDIEQTNKRHLNPKSGRKFQENKKSKLNENNKVDYKDSRGQSFIKTKKKVDKVNAKAFAIQNVNKAKKKVALIVDRQTSKHTFQKLSESYLDAPQLVVLVGPKNSGKSSLLRTLMRHYTGNRVNAKGPVTVVTSKTKKVTFMECPNDLHSQIDLAKTADMILLMVNLKQGLQTETLEFIELLTAHGVPRVKLIFTHLDEFPKNDKKLKTNMKLIIKRIQLEIHALPFRLTEIKNFRSNENCEYKIEEVKNLARLIGQKNPCPNEWRSNHPYIVVDRLEKVNKEQLDGGIDKKNSNDFHEIKFYGYIRGCTMSSTINRMHLMGVDDLEINSIIPLNEPCPTPMQESKLPKKRQPLAIKERKAYAPMSGYGGVLKDSDGFHILNGHDEKDNIKSKKSDKESDEEIEFNDNENETSAHKSSLIRDLESSDEDDSGRDHSESEDNNTDDDHVTGKKRKFQKSFDGPSSKKFCLNSNKEDSQNLLNGFEDLQTELKTDNQKINYERLIYDDDYACNLNVLNKLQNDNKELSIDLFVTGTWNPNDDAATLLKRDDEARKKLNVENNSEDNDDEELNFDQKEEMDEDDVENYEEDEEDEEMDEDENYEDEEMDEDENYEEDEEMDEDENYEEYEMEKDKVTDKKIDLFEDYVPDTAALTEFQKKKLLRDSKTKREKKLEKKAKHKALFDELYDAKTGESSKDNFFEKWKEGHEKQEKKNIAAFENLDSKDAYKITGLKPGSYVCVVIKKVPKEFFDNFTPTRPVILGGLATGEETFAWLTASFKLSRHFEIKEVLKTEDPVCFSIGWRRIQSFCHYFNISDDGSYVHRKYSGKKGLHCNVAFLAPVVPVKTGFAAFLNFEPHEKFRIAALGSVLSKNDSVAIKKKLKFIGHPAKIFKKTAFITNMFNTQLEVMRFVGSQLKTTSGIRGILKKPLSKENHGDGAFRASFEAPILMSDIVFLNTWVTLELMDACRNIDNLLVKSGEVVEYYKLWNDYYRDNNIPLPAPKFDSNYRKVTREPFVAPSIKLSKKIIEKLPFINRPKGEELEDIFQKNRPKVVLDYNESKKAQLVDALLMDKEQRRSRFILEKQKFTIKKRKQMKMEEEKTLEKKKQKSKQFFKNKSIKKGEAKRKPVDK